MAKFERFGRKRLSMYVPCLLGKKVHDLPWYRRLSNSG
jgi:hypothetical protein